MRSKGYFLEDSLQQFPEGASQRQGTSQGKNEKFRRILEENVI